MKWRETLLVSHLHEIGHQIGSRYLKGQKKYKGYHGNPILHAAEELQDALVHLEYADERDRYARELLEKAHIRLDPVYHPALRKEIREFLEDAEIHPGFWETSEIEVK